jgi:hypothetical protein
MAKIYQHMTQRYRNQEAVSSLLTKCYHLSPQREVLGTVKHKQAMLVSERERKRGRETARCDQQTYISDNREEKSKGRYRKHDLHITFNLQLPS